MNTDQYSPPDRPCNYVAYAKDPKRVGNADTGEAIDFRPSLFVREYPSILVKEFARKTGEHNGETFEFASVKFDASSAGMEGFKNDFGASVEADSQACALLEKAHSQQQPVTVLLETVRKAKHGDTQEPISPLTYIHDLRGAQPDGKKGNANQTGDTCKNIVAGVGAAGNAPSFAFTTEMQADPAELADLRHNRDHTLPPNGWRVHQGGIIPTSSASDTGGTANIDVEDLAACVAAQLKPIMGGASGDRPRPRQQDAFAVEAKEWEPWNSDGRLNLGGYLAAKERAMFDEAVSLVTSVDAADVVPAAWRVVPALHWMADKVQADTYGPGAKPNRCAKSHFEASKWVAWVYWTLSQQPGNEALAFSKRALDDSEALRAWAQQVAEVAYGLFTQATQNVQTHLTGDHQPPAQAQENPTTPAEASSDSDPQSQEQPAQADTADREPEQAPLDEWATTAANPALKEQYERLLADVGQADHPERFHALLTQKFGAWQLRNIDYDSFQQALNEWVASPQQFINDAHAAWKTQVQS